MSRKEKPSKPYSGFPLFAHASGVWAKKISGKLWYFGPWENPDAALAKFNLWLPEIRAGRDPRKLPLLDETSSISVADMFNSYLEHLEQRADAGEITRRHFHDNLNSARVVTERLGRDTAVDSLRVADFEMLRRKFPKSWSPQTTGNHIQRIRTAFRWAAEAEVIEAEPKYGPRFQKPQAAVLRRGRQSKEAEHGKLIFEAEELRQLIAAATGYLKPCVLLGINAGFGASDCGKLRKEHVADEWYDLPRAKTGVPRQAWLWPETCRAIETHRASSESVLCFETIAGKPVWWELDDGQRCDNVGKEFTKLSKKLEIYRKGRSFYSLRRTFRTVASEAGDEPAADLVMGHDSRSMASLYTRGIQQERIKAVCGYVRQWLALPEDT